MFDETYCKMVEWQELGDGVCDNGCIPFQLIEVVREAVQPNPPCEVVLHLRSRKFRVTHGDRASFWLIRERRCPVLLVVSTARAVLAPIVGRRS